MTAPGHPSPDAPAVITDEDLDLLRETAGVLVAHAPVKVPQLVRVMDTLFKGVAIRNRVPTEKEPEEWKGAQAVLDDIRRTLAPAGKE